jgi:hypothetical protein
VRALLPSPHLKILQYRFRRTSIMMQGPMSALHFLQVFQCIIPSSQMNSPWIPVLHFSLQTLSKHVREEAARNYVMSEALLCAVQGPEHYHAIERPHNGVEMAPWLRYPISDALIRQYVVDCSLSMAPTAESVPELNVCPSLVDSLAPEHAENAAEAAIGRYKLKRIKFYVEQVS